MQDHGEKLDRITELIQILDRVAAAIAYRHNVRSNWFEIPNHRSAEKPMVRVRRFDKQWHIAWKDERGERMLMEASILDKCAFLEVADEFFEQYHAIAGDFPSRLADAIAKGEKVAGWAAQMGYLDPEEEEEDATLS
jgi:hypothetical protein